MPSPGRLENPAADPPFPCRPLAAAVVIAVAALAAYANSFTGPLVFDDTPSIADNPTIRQLWPPGSVLNPPVWAGVAARPVLNLSFGVNYAISGVNVGSYHAVNLLVHVLAGLTLCGVLRRTFRRLHGRVRAAADPLALAAAVLWLVHPVQTASVTYLSQRAESLMALWYLLALYGFIRAAEPGASAGPRRTGWMALSVGCCALGMATKEVMVTAPLVFLLYDRVFLAGTWAGVWRQRWPLHLALAGTWAILAWLMLDVHAQGRAYGQDGAWLAYAWTECRVVLHYLIRAIWPHPLVFDAGVKAGGDATPGHVLALAALLALTLLAVVRRPQTGFAAAWFFLVLAPTSSVVPIVDQPMAENRVYLALAGVVVLAVCGLHTLLGRRAWPVCGVLAVAGMLVTARRNLDYRSEVRLWGDTIAKCPDNARAHNNLGTALADVPGRIADEIAAYETALRLDPAYTEARLNLGRTLAGEPGRLEEAVGHLAFARQAEPGRAETHLALGNVLARSGRLPEALAAHGEAVRLAPGSVEARINFATGLAQAGRLAEAIAQYEAVLRVQPEVVAARLNLGVLLAGTDRLGAAMAHFEAAVRLAPDSVAARHGLATALEQSGRIPEALTQFAAAVRLAPGDADLRADFGQSLLSAGRAEEAVTQFAAALRLRPEHPAARAGLDQARIRAQPPSR